MGMSYRELKRDFLAPLVEVKTGNERVRWREEWPERTIVACGLVCQ